jgi:hypothetical protein
MLAGINYAMRTHALICCTYCGYKLPTEFPNVRTIITLQDKAACRVFLSVHIHRSPEMCCALCLIHDEVLTYTFLDRFCRIWPGDANISLLDGPHSTKTMEAKYQCAEAALKRELQNIARCEHLEAIMEDLKDSIGTVLERGEKLEDLVATSGKLSQKSREFHVKVGENEFFSSREY